MKFTNKSNENIEYLKKYYTIKGKYALKSKYALKLIHNVFKKINIHNYKYTFKYSYLTERPEYYFPSEIVNTINKTQYNIYSFLLKKHKYNFRINIYSETPLQMESYIRYIKTILVFFIHHKPIQSSSYHTINIYLTPYEKKLIHNPIQPLDINSGFSNRINVTIFRKEEWIKVFIHECIHIFYFDDINQISDDIFHTYFNIKDELLLNELYTEFWSRILNICCLSLNKSFTIFYNRFTKYINMDQLYSALSLKKILKWNHMTYVDLYNKHRYKEETNTFCYYVLTALLYYNIDDTLNFFLVHNKNLIYFDTKYTKEFMRFVYRLHKNKSWVDYLNGLNYFNTPNINMSLYDLEFT